MAIRTRTLSLIAKAKLGAMLLFGLACWPSSATANILHQCGGSPSGIDSGELDLFVNGCSVTGTPLAAVEQAAAQWNWVSNLPVRIGGTRWALDCHVYADDGHNDWALAARSTIDGNNGETSLWSQNVCFDPPGMHGDWSEADVLIANDLNFDLRAPSDMYYRDGLLTGTGRGTTVHEMSHQLGLDHGVLFSTLNVGDTRPGGFPFGPGPMPPDVFENNSIYGTKGVVDLAPSGSRLVSSGLGNGTVVTNHEYTEAVCRNGRLNLSLTALNFGSANVVHNQKVFLSATTDGANPVATWTINGATAFVGGPTSHTLSATIPVGVADGEYYLFHRVDSSFTVTELLEFNNMLRYTGKVRVKSCHGFVIKSDTNLGLAFKGGPDGTNLTLSNTCTKANPDCTWQYRDGMLISDRDPSLAINASGGAVHGTILKVRTGCVSSNPDCTWTYKNGQFVSDRNASLPMNAWGGAINGTVIRLHNGCNPTLSDCTFTSAGMMISSSLSSTLHWNAWGGAAFGTEVRLHRDCDVGLTDCTWTLRKGMIQSDTNSTMAVNAFGGAGQLVPLKLHNGCNPSLTDCTWTWKRGMLSSDTNAFGVNAVGGSVHGASLKLNNQCQASLADCNFLAREGVN